MKKFIIINIIVFMCTTGGGLNTVFANNIAIQVDKQKLVNNDSIIFQNGSYFIEINEVFDLLNATVYIDDDANIIISNFNTEVLISKDGSTIFINGEEGALPYEIFYEGDKIYIPFGFIAKELDAIVTINEDVISITPNKINFNIYTNVNNSDVEHFSFEDALDRAVRANRTLKNLDDTLRELNARRDIATTQRELANGVSEDVFISALRNVINIDNSMISSRAQQRVIRETIEFTLSNYISSIAQSELDIQLFEESIKLTESEVEVMKLRNSLGLISDIELNTAYKNLQESNATLEIMRNNFETQRQTLNVLLGIDVNRNIRVEYDPYENPIFINNLETFVLGRVEEDPTIERLRMDFEQAEFKFNNRLSSELGIEIRNQMNSISRELEERKDNIGKTVRNAFNSLQNLEQNRATLELRLQEANDRYNVARVNFEAGLITENELNQAKLAILSIRIDMEKIKYDYGITKLILRQPYLSMN